MVLALAMHWKVAPGNKVIGGINGANTFGGEVLQVALGTESLPDKKSKLWVAVIGCLTLQP
jgi:hypothetical protein